MAEKLFVGWKGVQERAKRAAVQILHFAKSYKSRTLPIYGVPRGGIYAAQAVHAQIPLSRRNRFPLTDRASSAAFIVDDIIDSGATLKEYNTKYPAAQFLALYDAEQHTDELGNHRWIEFPWETMQAEQGVEENIRRVLQYIGEDPQREGLQETPDRVMRSWDSLYGGYKLDPASVFKVFQDGACEEMVLLKDVEFYSTCEHHMLPFYGKAHIAYVPNGRVVGISKLARLLEVFARRLQIQERIGQQITDALQEHLMPKGAACILEAQHLCMTARGVQKQNSVMVTSSLTGCFRNDAAARAELLQLIK